MRKRKAKQTAVRRRLRIECYEPRAMLAGPDEPVVANDSAKQTAEVVTVNESNAVLLNAASFQVASDSLHIGLDSFEVNGSLATVNSDAIKDIYADADTQSVLEFNASADVGSTEMVNGTLTVIADDSRQDAFGYRPTLGEHLGFSAEILDVFRYEIHDANTLPTVLRGSGLNVVGNNFDLPTPPPTTPSINQIASSPINSTGPTVEFKPELPDTNPTRDPEGTDTSTIVTDDNTGTTEDRIAVVGRGEGEPVVLSTFNTLLINQHNTALAQNAYEHSIRPESDSHSNGTIVGSPSNEFTRSTDDIAVAYSSNHLPNSYLSSSSAAVTLVSVQHSDVSLAFETDSEPANTVATAAHSQPLVPDDDSVSMREVSESDVAVATDSNESFSLQTAIATNVAKIVTTPTVLLVVATLWTHTNQSAKTNCKDDERARLSKRNWRG